MSDTEKFLRFLCLPVAVFAAYAAIFYGIHESPNREDFFMETILPLYASHLIVTAMCWQIVSGGVRQFLLWTFIGSSAFVFEKFLRVFMDIYLF